MIRHKATLKLATTVAALSLATAPSAFAAPRESDSNTGGGLSEKVVRYDEVGPIPQGVRSKLVPQQATKLGDSGWIAYRLRCADLPSFSCNGTVLVSFPVEVVVY